MNEEEGPFVLVGGSGNVVPDSRQYPCHLCGEQVWLSPVSQKQIVLMPQMKVACLSCAVTIARAYQATTQAATKGKQN